MPTLRMVQVEVEFGDPATCAEIIRLALGGEAVIAADAPEPAAFRFRAPVAVPELPSAPRVNELNAAPPVKRRGGRPPKAAAGAPAVPSSAALVTQDGSFQGRVLAALAKRPMTSEELAKELGVEPKQVYTPAGFLKSAGKIETFADDARDGQRRWRLVA